MQLSALLVSVLAASCQLPQTHAQSTGPQILAQSGCCKFRPDNNAQWRITDLNFDACRAHNSADDDDVLEQRGKFWWDILC